MPTIQSFQRNRTIATKLNIDNGAAVVTIFECNGVSNKSKYNTASDVITNGYIKNLRAKATIKSLAEVQMPVFNIEDTQSIRAQKSLNLEWGSARKQMDCYISWNNSSWFCVGSVSLLNPSGYPYRSYNLQDVYTDNLALELGDNGRIGIGISDAGYGLLSGADEVIIYGSYLEEVIIVS